MNAGKGPIFHSLGSSMVATRIVRGTRYLHSRQVRAMLRGVGVRRILQHSRAFAPPVPTAACAARQPLVSFAAAVANEDGASTIVIVAL